MKADERIAFTLRDLGMHGLLDFRLRIRAQFVVFDKRELAGVNGKGRLREIAVIESASGKWCGYPMIVARRGEQTGLPPVNLQDAVVGIDRSNRRSPTAELLQEETLSPRARRSRCFSICSLLLASGALRELTEPPD